LEGYHGANAALQSDTALQSENEATIDALANMATAMSADRATMSQLTKSIAELTAQLTAKDNEIASLKNRPRNSNNNNNTSRNSNNNDRHQSTWRSHNASRMPDRGGYWWTHGYRVSKLNHISVNCRWKDDGHKDPCGHRLPGQAGPTV
jgi:hypothetical protein